MVAKNNPIKVVKTQKEFDKKVVQSTLPTIVIFKTGWSGEAYLLTEIFDKIWGELSQRFQLFSVDVEQLPDLKDRYFITNIPTVLFFRKGKVTGKIMQMLPSAIVKLHVNNFLESAKSA